MAEKAPQSNVLVDKSGGNAMWLPQLNAFVVKGTFVLYEKEPGSQKSLGEIEDFLVKEQATNEGETSIAKDQVTLRNYTTPDENCFVSIAALIRLLRSQRALTSPLSFSKTIRMATNRRHESLMVFGTYSIVVSK
jgi:hypothetical protein